MLPEVEPTGKKVEIGLVVITGIKDKKITHEHIYWDQASVLFQVGLIDSHNFKTTYFFLDCNSLTFNNIF